MKFVIGLLVGVIFGFAFQFCPFNAKMIQACPVLSKLAAACACGCDKCGDDCSCNQNKKCSEGCKCISVSEKK